LFHNAFSKFKKKQFTDEVPGFVPGDNAMRGVDEDPSLPRQEIWGESAVMNGRGTIVLRYD